MIKKYSLVFVAFLCFVLSGFGQSEIFNIAGGSTFPAGWTGTNNVAANTIDRGTYYLVEVDAGAPSDVITTAVYDLSAYVSAEFSLRVATFGSGDNNPAKIEISYDGGGTFTQTEFSATPTSSTYINGGVFALSSITNQVQIRISNNGTSGRGVRLRNLILEATAPIGPTITVSSTSLTGFTYEEGSGPSGEQSFTVEGSNLTDDIDISAPTDWEISTTSGSGFGGTVSLPETGGVVSSTTIYARIVSGLLNVNSPFSGNITATSINDGITENVSVEGSVTIVGGSNCTELFISEYVEGSSNNKYIEIYNPTNSAINLSGYSLELYSNGSATASSTENLSGTIPAYGTIVYANNLATIYAGTVTVTNVCNFNGDDAIALLNGSSYIDIIGTIGEDPGSAWTGTGGRSTENRTIRRNASVQIGVDSNPANGFPTFNSEWEVYGQDTVSDLGNHTSDCQGPTPELQLVEDTATNQNCGYTIDFGTQAVSTNTDLTFDIKNVGSADLDISSFGITGDYSIISPTAPLTITSGNSETVTIRFTPTATGTRNGVLTINNNDSNESACTVNLTGVGFVPAPEIDIERSTGSSIPNGAAANIGYNTIFASTVMGNSSVPKTYHVSNEGTANLNLTSITSSNPSEFAISLNPGASTITPGTEVDFEITFSPTGVGVRTAIITIISNDADENPYTFNVQGNGDCAAGTLTFFPNNGPVGTVVNVTSSNYNFGGSTTATVNGVPASVNIISNNEMEVTIPTGAATGNLEINDDLGCLSSDLFIVVDKLISDCEGSSGSTPSDLFISEVTDHGSGSHSYVEIFNGTGAAINLTNYEIRLHNNGATTPTHIIPLVGTVASNDVFVLAFGSGDATDPNSTHGYDQSDNATGINEDDHIRLYNSSTNTWIDLWGDISGNVFTVASKNYTYRRKNSGIIAPSTTWNVNDWDAFTPVDYSDIGSYDFSTGTPPSITVEPVLPSTNCNLTASISVTATEGYSGGNPLAYQWYYSAPGDTGWTAVPDNAIYDDVTTNTLQILNTLTLDGYQYYCQIRENDALCFKASNAVKLHVQKAEWDGTQWLNGITPDQYTIATITGDYTTNATNGSFTACQLFVTSGSLLTIAQGYFVEVINNVEVTGDGTDTDGILIEDKGSFVQRGDGLAAGSFTLNTNGFSKVNKRTAPLNNYYEYTYWSSPTVDETVGEGLFEAHPTRRYWYNAENYLDETAETNNNNGTVNGQDDIDDNGDDWQPTANGDIMIPGVGYAAMHDPIGFGIVGAGGQFEYIFEGAFNTGDIDVPIYRNDSELQDNNWNLIGNPYPSAVDADLFLTANTLIAQDVSELPVGTGTTDGAIFFWSQSTAPSDTANGNENLNFAQSDYAIINATGQTAGGDNNNDGFINGLDVPDRFIPSGQGFFISYSNTGTVDATNGNINTGTVSFTNSMRVTGNNNQFFRNSSTQANRLWVNMWSDNGVRNQILVGYVEGATDLYDGMYYDAPKNSSAEINAMIYTVADNSDKKLAIQGKALNSLHLEEVIPIGFYTLIPEATLYSISIDSEGLFFDENTVYLRDYELEILHNLNDSPYTFTSETGEFNERFEIVFRDSFLSVNEEEISANNLTIIELQNGEVQFTVPSQHKIQSVEIIDLLGKTIYNLKGNSSTETYNLSNLSQATYVARVTLASGQVLTKKAVKRK